MVWLRSLKRQARTVRGKVAGEERLYGSTVSSETAGKEVSVAIGYQNPESSKKMIQGGFTPDLMPTIREGLYISITFSASVFVRS